MLLNGIAPPQRAAAEAGARLIQRGVEAALRARLFK
jgi:hypothetical protein